MSGLMPLGRNPPPPVPCFFALLALRLRGPAPPPIPLHCPLPSSLGRSFLASRSSVVRRRAPPARALRLVTRSSFLGSGRSFALLSPVAAGRLGARQPRWPHQLLQTPPGPGWSPGPPPVRGVGSLPCGWGLMPVSLFPSKLGGF